MAPFDDAGAQTGIFLHTLDPSTAAILSTVDISLPGSAGLFHVGGLAVRPTDGLLFASARPADVTNEGDVYTLTAAGELSFIGDTHVGDIGDLVFRTSIPSALLLLGSGLAGIATAARQRRRE